MEKQIVQKFDIRKARKEWDDRVGRTSAMMKTWRAMTLFLAASLFVVLFWAGAKLQQPRMIPYVVEINGDQINFKGVMTPQKMTITEAVAHNYLIRFITNLCSISSDPVALKKNLADCYQITSPQAQIMLTDYIMHNDPLGKCARNITQDVRITLLAKEAEHTWRVEWIQETRDKGMLAAQTQMVATLTYDQGFPQTPEQADVNPAGWFFTQFFITERKQ